MRARFMDPGAKLEIMRSVKYGSMVIHSLVTGAPWVIYGNFPDNGLITNLPAECVVELPCLVDANCIQQVHVGRLPPQLAALIQTNVNVQSLKVEAAVTGRREHVYHAAVLDPHTAAELDLDQIWALVNDLLEEHRGWIPHDPPRGG
ncbi:MAG: hypothetical protein JO122_05550 [Acetobacteraceae bacterium]|nr:hypothetical protein [Acetobacteraceae bacterium]